MISVHRHGGIAEIRIESPPVNALGSAVRLGLVEAFAEAGADPAIAGVVLTGGGRLFSGGADIAEFDGVAAEPSLPAVIERIEGMDKPVVAALHGSALGGGLELALACHYRVAAAGTRLGLPEVKLGLIPGAGGTQRLPRLIGVEQALAMIVTGNPVSAGEAAALGLVDAVVEGDCVAQAIAFARERAGERADVRRTGALPIVADPGVFDRFAAAHARLLKGVEAPNACIEAVRAATGLPLAEGLAKERALFLGLKAGDQSKALRHAFFAERQAAKIDDLPAGTPRRPIGRVGVIGAGTMGGGISMNFLSAGIPVTIVEMAQDALDRGVATIRRNYEATAAKGRLTAAQVEAATGLLTPTLDFTALAGCDLVIEAVYENMDVKQEIFARLDGIARPGAILASNTSYLDVDTIAAATARPQDVLGLHFFSPANVMKLVEVVRGAKTAPDVLATGMDLARRIGKVPVMARVCYGFIGNRMLSQRQRGAIALLIEGASPAQVDRVHTAFGMPMGPFQMADLAGVDIGWHRDPARIESIADALNAQGRWGQKKGAGYYDYDAARKPSPSPVTERIITDFRALKGVAPRAISDEEIGVRTLYTMVNEAVLILEEGIAQRASDIDTVWLNGYGWPRHTGGPVYWAERIGLPVIVAGLETYRERLAPGFRLSPLLARRAAEGGRLSA